MSTEMCIRDSLITGLGTFPTYHGVTLRAQESSGEGGEVKTGSFFFYHDASRIAIFGHFVAESNIVVAYAEYYIYIFLFFVGKGCLLYTS